LGRNGKSYKVVKILDEDFASGAPGGPQGEEKDDQWLSVEMACVWEEMKKAASQAKIGLKIRSGFRTGESQERRYKKTCAGTADRGCSGRYIAPPEKSKHSIGKAIDFNSDCTPCLSKCLEDTAPAAACDTPIFKWLKTHAHKFSLHSPLASSPNHWELTEEAPPKVFLIPKNEHAGSHGSPDSYGSMMSEGKNEIDVSHLIEGKNEHAGSKDATSANKGSTDTSATGGVLDNVWGYLGWK